MKYGKATLGQIEALINIVIASVSEKAKIDFDEQEVLKLILGKNLNISFSSQLENMKIRKGIDQDLKKFIEVALVEFCFGIIDADNFVQILQSKGEGIFTDKAYHNVEKILFDIIDKNTFDQEDINKISVNFYSGLS